MGRCSSCPISTAHKSTPLDHWSGSRTERCDLAKFGNSISSFATVQDSDNCCSITSYHLLRDTSDSCSGNCQIWSTEEMVSSCHGCGLNVQASSLYYFCLLISQIYNMFHAVVYHTPQYGEYFEVLPVSQKEWWGWGYEVQPSDF